MTFRINLIDKHGNEDKTECEMYKNVNKIQKWWSGLQNEIERNHKIYKQVNKIEKNNGSEIQKWIDTCMIMISRNHQVKWNENSGKINNNGYKIKINHKVDNHGNGIPNI